MKRRLLVSLALVFMVALGTNAATADAAERDRMMIPGTPEPSSRGEPEYPATDAPEKPAVSAPSSPCPPPPKAGPYGNLGGTPGSYAGKCCGGKPPFPGLDCCDSRDCGWFDCDSAMRMQRKKPGRVK